MEHGRLPLTKWYLAIYLVTQSKTNIAALALRRQLGVSWKAAWLLKHKLMEVMAQRDADRPLRGEVRRKDLPFHFQGQRFKLRRTCSCHAIFAVTSRRAPFACAIIQRHLPTIVGQSVKMSNHQNGQAGRVCIGLSRVT
jgi:hypothetical protein